MRSRASHAAAAASAEAFASTLLSRFVGSLPMAQSRLEMACGGNSRSFCAAAPAAAETNERAESPPPAGAPRAPAVARAQATLEMPCGVKSWSCFWATAASSESSLSASSERSWLAFRTPRGTGRVRPRSLATAQLSIESSCVWNSASRGRATSAAATQTRWATCGPPSSWLPATSSLAAAQRMLAMPCGEKSFRSRRRLQRSWRQSRANSAASRQRSSSRATAQSEFEKHCTDSDCMRVELSATIAFAKAWMSAPSRERSVKARALLWRASPQSAFESSWAVNCRSGVAPGAKAPFARALTTFLVAALRASSLARLQVRRATSRGQRSWDRPSCTASSTVARAGSAEAASPCPREPHRLAAMCSAVAARRTFFLSLLAAAPRSTSSALEAARSFAIRSAHEGDSSSAWQPSSGHSSCASLVAQTPGGVPTGPGSFWLPVLPRSDDRGARDASFFEEGPSRVGSCCTGTHRLEIEVSIVGSAGSP
mmetsp:Transcript_100645/g.217296  ORF Transcript_100645/g.217296 Transcript_100645/m.217296 type:complete len:485 (+) Transcript_100645:488-1942(+)